MPPLILVITVFQAIYQPRYLYSILLSYIIYIIIEECVSVKDDTNIRLKNTSMNIFLQDRDRKVVVNNIIVETETEKY